MWLTVKEWIGGFVCVIVTEENELAGWLRFWNLVQHCCVICDLPQALGYRTGRLGLQQSEEQAASDGMAVGVKLLTSAHMQTGKFRVDVSRDIVEGQR